MVSEGMLGGIAGTVVFLPQICLLFFLISLLEDTGYLARAAFVMDRLLCRFGLPGHAFVPLLTSHACALPGIMSARLIPDPRDRLVTILVAPMMSCSARLPVYVLLTSLLFAGQPVLAGLAFAGSYMLGAGAALTTAMVFGRTILKGRARPDGARTPELQDALPHQRPAGRTRPGLGVPADCGHGDHGDLHRHVVAERVPLHANRLPRPRACAPRRRPREWRPTRAAALEVGSGEPRGASARGGQLRGTPRPGGTAGLRTARLRLAADDGRAHELPRARGVRLDDVGAGGVGQRRACEDEGVITRIRNARRADGTPLFTQASSASLLVFFVLAMQCLPTLTVTRRETGSAKWAGLQLAYMTTLAYVFSLVTYQGLRALGVD